MKRIHLIPFFIYIGLTLYVLPICGNRILENHNYILFFIIWFVLTLIVIVIISLSVAEYLTKSDWWNKKLF